MKKLIIILSSLLFLLLLLGIMSCSKHNKVWLVSIGEPKESVEHILNNEKIKYTDPDTAINIKTSVTYLDVEWNETTSSFENVLT